MKEQLGKNGVSCVENALTYSLPTHMGTDSESMMDKANVMINLASKSNDDRGATWWIKRNPFTKPWGLQPGEVTLLYWNTQTVVECCTGLTNDKYESK